MRREDQLDGQEVDQGLRLLGGEISPAHDQDRFLHGLAAGLRVPSAFPVAKNAHALPVFREIGQVEKHGERPHHQTRLLRRDGAHAGKQGALRAGLALPARARSEADLLLQLVEGETRLLADHPAQKPSEEVYFRTELFAFLHLSPSM